MKSTVNGSGIDDRCPTTYGTPAALREGGSGRKRIDWGLLRKLAIATEKEQKAKDVEKRNFEGKEGDAIVRTEQKELKNKNDHGFYVPKIDGRLNRT